MHFDWLKGDSPSDVISTNGQTSCRPLSHELFSQNDRKNLMTPINPSIIKSCMFHAASIRSLHPNAEAPSASQRITFIMSLEDDDERMARDLQLALDLQAKEEEREQQRRKNHATDDLGFATRKALQQPGHMLFVICDIEGRAVEMLVDSGASSSVISMSQVHQLGLESHLETNVTGQAAGVGAASIVGILENITCGELIMSSGVISENYDDFQDKHILTTSSWYYPVKSSHGACRVQVILSSSR